MTRSYTSEKPAGVRPAAVLATATLVLGLAATAWAGPGRAASQTPNEVRDGGGAEAARPSGVSVAIDPATGKVRQPTQAEVEALDRSFKSLFGSSVAAPQATFWPDGTVAIALTDEYLNVWVARINPDGSLSHGCVNGPDQANAFIAAGGPVLEEK